MALSEPTELNTFHSEINRLLDQFGIWCFWVEKLGGLRFKSKKGCMQHVERFQSRRVGGSESRIRELGLQVGKDLGLRVRVESPGCLEFGVRIGLRFEIWCFG